MDPQHVLSSIYRAIDEVNLQLPPEKRLGKSTDTVLYAQTGCLDSLGIVNLILLTEEAIYEELGVQLELTSTLRSSSTNPFRDVGSFAEHVSEMLRMV